MDQGFRFILFLDAAASDVGFVTGDRPLCRCRFAVFAEDADPLVVPVFPLGFSLALGHKFAIRCSSKTSHPVCRNAIGAVLLLITVVKDAFQFTLQRNDHIPTK